MTYRADPMFPGDLHDAAARFAADVAKQPPEAAWQQARAMGWTALLVDEARGGAGGTLADLAAVVEACARHVSALPLVRRCAVAPALLMAAGNPQADATLRALCGGTIDVDVASGAGVRVSAPTSTVGSKSSSGFDPSLGNGSGSVCLSGTLEQADATFTCSHLLVPTPGHLLLLPRAALPAAWPQRQQGLDGRCTADLPLQGIVVPASVVLASGAEAAAAAQAGADLAALVTAIEIAATLGALVEHCIAHLGTRVQFGVALATFQALRHRVVEMYVHYQAASVMLERQVADTVRSGHLASRDAALAKLYLNDLARRNAEVAIQLHGGMGMTTELPATRLAQRLIAAEFEHGTRLALLDALEALVPAGAGGDADGGAERGADDGADRDAVGGALDDAVGDAVGSTPHTPPGTGALPSALPVAA